MAGEEGGADGDEDDGQVDLPAGVGRLRTGACNAGRTDSTEKKSLPMFSKDTEEVGINQPNLLAYLGLVRGLALTVDEVLQFPNFRP